MPALIPTEIEGRVIWLGRVADREETLCSASADRIAVTFAGAEGEDHGGLTRPSCVRVKAQYPEDTEIRNVRQFSIVSAEDLAAIAAEIGLDVLDPSLLGATMVIEGIPDFTLVPPSSRLQFADGATLTVDMENHACNFPAREIEKRHPGAGKGFRAAARRRRGVTAWTEREGAIAVGDAVRLHIPGQPAWPHLDRARGEG